MKAQLSLEVIGHESYQMLRQFDRAITEMGFKVDPKGDVPVPCMVAIVTFSGDSEYRHPLQYKTDYSKANSNGSRGVYRHYILESGVAYWVKERTSWKSTREYYVAVGECGRVYELEREEVLLWLSED